MPLLQSAAWLLLALALLPLLYWAIVWVRVRRTMQSRPTVRAGLDLPEPPDGWPSVSIVVPVHNEQRVIDACCRSLRAQDYPNLHIIFVLDRCTDQTRSILQAHADEDPRIRLIGNEHCPPDWAGKCNAARLGADHATGDWILFTDADTTFDPALVRAAVALAHHRNIALLSLLSTLTFERTFERVVQPVATLNLIRIFPLERINRDKRPRPFANGQFMLFDARIYRDIGGHEAVKDDLLEDIAFARRVHAANHRPGMFIADGMLICSMYDSFTAFHNGWKRIFIEACRRYPVRLRRYARRTLITGLGALAVRITALIIGALLIAAGNLTLGLALIAVVLLSWGMQILSLSWIYSLGGAPRIASLLYPVGCWFVARVMYEGARDLTNRTPIRWAGKEYILEPRDRG